MLHCSRALKKTGVSQKHECPWGRGAKRDVDVNKTKKKKKRGVGEREKKKTPAPCSPLTEGEERNFRRKKRRHIGREAGRETNWAVSKSTPLNHREA